MSDENVKDGQVVTGTSVLAFTSQIVAAFLSHNQVQPGEQVFSFIRGVHATLAGLEHLPAANLVEATEDSDAAVAEAEARRPAVPIEESVQPDFIVNLFTGKKYKSLRRNIMTSHGMTPEQYRAHWNLPDDYPFTAPNYSKARSELAKNAGLGSKSGGRPRKNKPAEEAKAEAQAEAAE